jgi:hypothetical protein
MFSRTYHFEEKRSMKNEITLARLMEQWPDLQKRADNETDPDKLITLLMEVEAFLQQLEAQVVTDATRKIASSISLGSLSTLEATSSVMAT